jgi:hypothetical protein
MAKHAGIKSRIKLENASGTEIDISHWLNGVQGNNSQEWIDVTTFQPDVVGPALKDEIPGFQSSSRTYSGLWSEEAQAFFTGINGRQNLSYTEQPAAGDGVDTTITGECSVGGYSGPIYGVTGAVTFTVEIRITTLNLSGSPA